MKSGTVASGAAGTSGIAGVSGAAGTAGAAGASGIADTSGAAGASGTAGATGTSAGAVKSGTAVVVSPDSPPNLDNSEGAKSGDSAGWEDTGCGATSGGSDAALYSPEAGSKTS